MTDTRATETKSDWPKFSGDMKKFRHWYLAVVAQLSLSPWKEFYDSNTNDDYKYICQQEIICQAATLS